MLQLPDTVSKEVHAVYEKIHGDYEAKGKVFLEFVWAEPKSIFEPPPPMTARAKLVRPFVVLKAVSHSNLNKYLELTIYNS